MKTDDLIVPYVGLKQDINHFEFKLNKQFFGSFENSLIGKSDILLQLEFDKSLSPYELRFSFEGQCDTSCDKCTADIQMPIYGDFTIFVKFHEEAESLENDVDVIYIKREDDHINLRSIVYDMILLSLPMIKSCNQPFETEYCDKTVAKYLEENKEIEIKESTDPRWNALKDLLKNKD